MSHRVKDLQAEKLISVDINDTVRKALEETKNIDAKKIAVKDNLENFWVISYWKLKLLDPNITLKQAYDNNREIFEIVKTVSSDEEIFNISNALYSLPGLIVIEKEKVKGFISLANFSESELEWLKRPLLTLEQIKQMAKVKGGLAGINLHGYDLKEIDLRDSDLRGVDFSGADLSKADLQRADLTGANLSNARLIDAKLIRAKLNGANLKGAILIGADLRFAQLWSADLENADLQYANLKDSVLFSANLKLAKLNNAVLYNAGLMSANLEGAVLRNADISSANLKYAIFDEKTDLKDIEINSITIDNLTDSALKADWNLEVKQFLKEKYG